MARKRKTLEQHVSELIEEFDIEAVKAAVDTMYYITVIRPQRLEQRKAKEVLSSATPKAS